MGLRNLWSRAVNRLRPDKLFTQLNDQCLIRADSDAQAPAVDSEPVQGSQVVVKTVQPGGKPESLEKLQEGFDRLIGQLQAINEHLNRQLAQHEDLTRRMDELPQLLESFPAAAENQKQLIEQLLEQLRSAAVRDEQFIDTVEKIPTETTKQTDALVDIDHQLAAAAGADAQMAEGFNRFNETLDELNQSTLGQTDAICQMSRTFATSDRYLKYIISRQNKRFMWIFTIAIGVCALAVLILTGIIIYLRQ